MCLILIRADFPWSTWIWKMDFTSKIWEVLFVVQCQPMILVHCPRPKHRMPRSFIPLLLPWDIPRYFKLHCILYNSFEGEKTKLSYLIIYLIRCNLLQILKKFLRFSFSLAFFWSYFVHHYLFLLSIAKIHLLLLKIRVAYV